MANLLNKLRIDFSSLTMLQGVTEKPNAETIDMHKKILANFIEREQQQSVDNCTVSLTEIARLEDKTNRQLRLREMLLQHSTDASLIIMSLPMPRKVSFIKILRYLNDGYNQPEFFFTGYNFCTTLYVMVGNVNKRYATIFTCTWQSKFSINALFLIYKYRN